MHYLTFTFLILLSLSLHTAVFRFAVWISLNDTGAVRIIPFRVLAFSVVSRSSHHVFSDTTVSRSRRSLLRSYNPNTISGGSSSTHLRN